LASIIEGCETRAAQLGNVRCECFGSDSFSAEDDDDDASERKLQFLQQDFLIANLTLRGDVDGIAVAVRFPDQVEGSISDAVDAGIPVVTFDSDAPLSKRSVYIGTDNVAMGNEVGKVLKQLRPNGGKYALVSGVAPNLKKRERGVREYLADTTWTELGMGDSPLIPDTGRNATLALDKMWVLAESHPELSAIIPVYGLPMQAEGWKEFANRFQDRIALVGTDMSELQIDLLSKGYVDGLVGQQPYEMGRQAMTVLLQLQDTTSSSSPPSEIFGTNFLELLRVPYVLPPVEFNYNYLGNIKILGYIAFLVVGVLSIGFGAWTFANRKKRVIMASQPEFLYLICAGVLIFASSIIAFGIDDEDHSLRGCDIACMFAPWLVSVGFVLTFSALFSKTWRINRLVHGAKRCTRIKLKAKDVMTPLIVLMAANVIVLLCWTVLAPLEFVRENDSGTDLWNRIISSYGTCKTTSGSKGNSIPYLVLIGLINIGALLIANIQAYIARDIQTEYSESKYIALVLGSIAQAAIIGVPVIALELDNPRVTYVIETVLIFVLSVVILLLMFVPKYICHQEWLVKQEKLRKEKEGKPKRDTSSLTTVEGSSAGEMGLRFMIMTPHKVTSQVEEANTKELGGCDPTELGGADVQDQIAEVGQKGIVHSTTSSENDNVGLVPISEEREEGIIHSASSENASIGWPREQDEMAEEVRIVNSTG